MLAKEQAATTKVQAYPEKIERENRWVRFIEKKGAEKNKKLSLVKYEMTFNSYSQEVSSWSFGQVFAGEIPQNGGSRTSMRNWAMNTELQDRCHKSTTLPKDCLRCVPQ